MLEAIEPEEVDGLLGAYAAGGVRLQNALDSGAVGHVVNPDDLPAYELATSSGSLKVFPWTALGATQTADPHVFTQMLVSSSGNLKLCLWTVLGAQMAAFSPVFILSCPFPLPAFLSFFLIPLLFLLSFSQFC